MTARVYRYVGPEQVRLAAAAAAPGMEIHVAATLEGWLAAHVDDVEHGVLPATFVVSVPGFLRVADRRSEHIACAGGEPVLAAGEIFLAPRPPARVVAVSNLSTGFCPEPESWPAVALALDRVGVPHPGGYTSTFTFRRCEACGDRNLVKEDHFACALCGAELPAGWNFG